MELTDQLSRPKQAFPYLAAPDNRIFSAIKAFIARLLVQVDFN